jgi:hypothetical protein
MQAIDNIDFSKIDWNSISEGKADFLYKEALEHHKGIIEDNNRINDKALGMLSFTMPIMAALAGYFAITWENVSCSLLIAASWAGFCFLVITYNLLKILIPQSINQGAGSPGAYFTDEYYKRDMREMFIGNITNIHNCILQDRKVMNKRAMNFRLAVTFYAILPVTSFLAFVFSHQYF